jgi:hypothetical protein
LLKLEGLGFSQPEIVTQLSQKHECSRRTVYRDFEHRDQWQPALQNVQNPTAILMRTVNRYDQIYRQASIRLLTGTQEATQLGALNLMLKATDKICEVAVLPEILHRLRRVEEKARRGVFVQ